MATEQYGGMTINQLMATLSGLPAKDRAVIAGKWLVETGTHIQRHFNYKGPFAKTDPGCTPKFARSFAHTDWKDGQDVVQAEESASEDGFNRRFHRIEDDLDALNADTRTLFNCLAALRSNLADRLDEIKTELNLIDADIARLQDCCDHQGPVLVETADITPQIVGATKFFDQDVIVFQTGRGLTILPNVPRPGGGPDGIKKVMGLSRVLRENAKLRRAFAQGPLTTSQLVKDFGDVEIGEGLTLEDALAILPEHASYKSADALVKDAAERTAGAIRASGRAEEVLSESVGVGVTDTSTSPGITGATFVPSDAREALGAIGVHTMDDLAGRDGPTLVKALGQRGVTVTAGDAASWIAAAKTLEGIR